MFVAIAHFGNIFDIVMTLNALSLGAVEMNPIMDAAISVSPSFFVAVKLIIFTFAIALLAKRQPKWLKFVAGVYSLLAAWHCVVLYVITNHNLT